MPLKRFFFAAALAAAFGHHAAGPRRGQSRPVRGLA